MRLWEITNGKIVGKSIIEAHNEQIYDVCLSGTESSNKSKNPPDCLDDKLPTYNVKVATCSAWKNIKVWSLKLKFSNNEELKYSNSHSTPIKCTKIRKNEKIQIVTASEDSSLKLWGQKFNSQKTELNQHFEYLHFKSYATHIGCFDKNHNFNKDLPNDKIASNFHDNYQNYSDNELVIALVNGSVYLFNIEEAIEKKENYKCKKIFKKNSGFSELLCIGNDLIVLSELDQQKILIYRRFELEKFYFIGSIDHSVCCMTKDRIEPLKFYFASTNKGIYITHLKYSVFYNNPDSKINKNSYELTKKAEELEGITILCHGFDDIMICAMRDYSITLWILGSRNHKYRVFRGHTERIASLSVLDQFHYKNEFISCSRDMTIRRWNVVQRRQVFEYRGHQSFINDVGNDGEIIFSISYDKTLRSWKKSVKSAQSPNHHISLRTFSA